MKSLKLFINNGAQCILFALLTIYCVNVLRIVEFSTPLACASFLGAICAFGVFIHRLFLTCLYASELPGELKDKFRLYVIELVQENQLTTPHKRRSRRNI